MDSDTLAAVKAEVATAVDTVQGLAGSVAPQFLPLIVLGAALAKAAPDLVQDVEQLLAQAEPTQAETDELGAAIHGLLNPEGL